MTQTTSVGASRDGTCSDLCRTKVPHGTSIACQNRNPASSVRTSRSQRPRKETEVVSLSYHYCSRMLGLALRASFLLNKGAGGYSIAPSLHLQPLLNEEDSLGWRILTQSYSDRIYGTAPNKLELFVDHTIQELQHAFDLQKATPLDLTVRHSGVSYSLFDVGTTPHSNPTHFSHTNRFFSLFLIRRTWFLMRRTWVNWNNYSDYSTSYWIVVPGPPWAITMEVTHSITGKTSPSLEKNALWARVYSTLAILSLFALLFL